VLAVLVTHTSSVLKRERGSRPISESGRRTSRSANVTVASTLRVPNDAITVYSPAS
jgi:hypothetical protein